ncbi:MAG: hydrogenase maturation protease [Verrucomicrobiales bacterium]|nr:hydrogenase maturation protease [Verrucomicrobiales bacterium]
MSALTSTSGTAAVRPTNDAGVDAPPSRSADVLVLGLGNAILSDDAIGLRVVRALQQRLEPGDPVVAEESEEMGLALLDSIVGYRELVLVDAIQTGTQAPGYLHEFDGDSLPTRRSGAPHFLGVGDTLALGRLLGLPMPERVTIFAVEVADPFTLGTDLTPAVQEALLPALERVWARLRSFRHADGCLDRSSR